MDTHKRLNDLIEGFDTAMLVTREAGGSLRARPMAVAGLAGEAEAYFATASDSGKIAEIETDPAVLLVFQSAAAYVSVSGRAEVIRDRALIEKLWSPAWKAWFPGGKTDPALCLLHVAPTAAEYWDNSGARGLRYLFESAKAVLQGRQPESDPDQHAKVDIQARQ